MRTQLNVIILAAGQGRRMKSTIPKVLHTIAGKPLLECVVDAANKLQPHAVFVVCGHQGDKLQESLANLNVKWVPQGEQLGTGHAVLQVLPYLDEDSLTLVLFGDVPLISEHTLEVLVKTTPQNGVSLLVGEFEDPTGLGRIIRDENNVLQGIVEDKDATSDQRRIKEAFTGIMACYTKQMKQWLAQVDNDNSQQEYYLTEIPRLALIDNHPVSTVKAPHYEEVQGVNNKKQLAVLERYFQHREAERLMLEGVILRDPKRFELRGELAFGNNVEIDINVLIEGKVFLDDNTLVGSNTVLRNVTIGKNVIIKSHSVLEDAIIGDNCVVGPFARIRPGTELKTHVQVGNFVEIKQSTLGQNSKASHLSYIGDATVGKQVNIGAGTITCNYDGVNKHQTTIGNNAFIGSDSQLVAPVSIGDNATIGAGSTIVSDAPANQLTLSRTEQISIADWQRPEKSKEHR